MKNSKLPLLALLFVCAFMLIPLGSTWWFRKTSIYPVHTTLLGLKEVGRLDYHIESGSVATIIHLKQASSVEAVQSQMSSEDRKYIASVQKDLCVIARKLQKVFGINQIYAEGVSEEVLTNISPAIKAAREAYAWRETVNQFSGDAQDGLGYPKSTSADTILTDAFLLLAVENGFELRPGSVADTKEMPDSAFKAVAGYYRKGETNRFAPVISCGFHDFRDISEWNKTNSLKFSVLSVTPRSLRR